MAEPTTFELFDSDGDGCVTQEEFGLILRAQGYCVSDREIVDKCKVLKNPNRISLAEFNSLSGLMSKPKKDAESEMIEAFRVFDREENGLISENELRVIFTSLGEPVLLDDINSLLKEVQVDENGKVKYADFVKAILKA